MTKKTTDQKRHTRTRIIVISLGIASLVTVALLTYFFIVQRNAQNNSTTQGAGAVCDSAFMKNYADRVYPTETRQAYASEVQAVAEQARKRAAYETDINCVYVSFEAYVYAEDAANARTELTRFEQLDAAQDLDQSAQSFNSLDAMKTYVSSLEWNSQLKSGEGESDGEG